MYTYIGTYSVAAFVGDITLDCLVQWDGQTIEYAKRERKSKTQDCTAEDFQMIGFAVADALNEQFETYTGEPNGKSTVLKAYIGSCVLRCDMDSNGKGTYELLYES